MIAAAPMQCLLEIEIYLQGSKTGLLFVCRLRAWRQE